MENKKFNLYILFDYVYYAIVHQYYKWNYEIEKEFSGIIMLSLIQQFNIFIILGFFKINPFLIVNDNPIYSWLIGAALLFTINGIRYKKIITYDELHKRWGNDDKKTNFIKKSLVLFYIIMTMVLLIISIQWYE